MACGDRSTKSSRTVLHNQPRGLARGVFAAALLTALAATVIAGSGCSGLFTRVRPRPSSTAWNLGGPHLTAQVHGDSDEKTARCLFTEAFYGKSAAGTPTIALRGSHVRSNGLRVEEILIIEVLWKPNPGVTFADPSCINCTMTYIIDTSGSVLVFRGAGFMRLSGNESAGRLKCNLQSSNLHLAGYRGFKTPPIMNLSITGRFTAVKNDSQTARLVLQAKRYGPDL